MIPRDFIYKFMFIYLYNFANGRILLYILGLYIAIPLYYRVNDYSMVGMFILFFLTLITQPFFIENDLKKEFLTKLGNCFCRSIVYKPQLI